MGVANRKPTQFSPLKMAALLQSLEIAADWERYSSMRAPRLEQILRDFRRGVEQIYGPRLADLVLFSSQARNDAELDSDIDVMLVLRGVVNPSQEIHRLSSFTSDLCLKHDAVISCVYVSEEDFQRQQSPLMLNVRREGVMV